MKGIVRGKGLLLCLRGEKFHIFSLYQDLAPQDRKIPGKVLDFFCSTGEEPYVSIWSVMHLLVFV